MWEFLIGFAAGSALALISIRIAEWRQRRRWQRVRIHLDGLINRDVQ